ncbi:MAG TPA: hypothetical protein VK171_00665, partial [Fimbriimonas sp.]|nr:hypothetical protein [Fimbriimonas sp.]
AVSHDRLSKIDDAIQIIQQSKTARKTQMDWYRYHANYGTFLVHKWASQGAKKYETQLLKESISEIEEALKLFPASHFGRERIQLALQKAWLNPEKVNEIFKPIPAEDLVVGISGIIMMGLGYELPDAYLMLRKKITDGGGLVQGVADHRFRELVNQGKPSLLATPKDLEPSTFFKDRLAEYKLLRADGERVHQARTKYFFDNLTEERHPDTDPNFWSKWKEEPYPAVGDIFDAAKHKESLTQLVGLSASIVVILIASVWILLARRK